MEGETRVRPALGVFVFEFFGDGLVGLDELPVSTGIVGLVLAGRVVGAFASGDGGRWQEGDGG